MSLEIYKQRVLSVLSENLKSPQPQMLGSSSIAEKLHMKVSDIQQVVKILHEKGAVVCNLEGQYSLITPEGLTWLQKKTYLSV